MLRAPLVAAVLALGAVLPACGGEAEPPRQEPKVRLALGGPADGAVVRTETVEVRGTVEPAGAHVQVLGREVAVDGSDFAAEVPLEPGANLIDVAASANGRRPAFAALRVVREERVTVPALAGREADASKDQLEALGLRVEVEDGGGFFDPLLPGEPKVCTVRPRAGAHVMPGTEVTIVVARDC